MTAIALFIAAICAIAVYTTLSSSRRKTCIPLPPGPPGGWTNNPQVKPYASYQDLERLAQEYGPVVTLRAGHTPMIMIARRREAIELMEKEGASLADRPTWVAASDIVSGGMRILLLSAGKRFRTLRRALHRHLQAKAIVEYEPLQMNLAKKLVEDIVAQPEEHESHARKFSSSLVLQMTYGKGAPSSGSDPDVANVLKCIERIGKAVRPGSYIVEKYPFLKYVPFYGRELRQWHRDEQALFSRQLNSVRTRLVIGGCFGKYLIESQKELGLDNDEMAYLAGTMFGAGSATTASTISFILQAAACFPEAQQAVQDQLDFVVGKDRAPTFAERDALPLVTAFVMEVCRWRPVGGSGFAHRASRDVIWNNFCIPEGAIVTGNHWTICRDPLLFDDPESFNIMRWINDNGRLKDDSMIFTFGFGRRVCPGQGLAEKSLFISAAMLLWAFRISEDSKRPIDLKAIQPGVNIGPLPFTVDFEERIDRLSSLLTE
ncbi:cytochrome P450 [Cylindrobasidium torrendii FP15055 ss-10]|uniref:Cytochrome P450 n=1 Tax=Cylindrobasidium torrendii FP15055 ss-10 TaxID=1314674 RepID=A0A0D7BLV1_9AGAR|nr:cytochrome P450 [Cylindrobasidium torrendii FP15055 ss-10]